MKKYLFMALMAFSFAVQAQPNINYKYLIVPEKFGFQKQPHQYRLNSLAKMLFEEKGYTLYFDNAELPTDLATDRCKALTVDVQERNTMFSTNLTVLLKDCKGNTVLKSKEGKSREKEFQAAYTGALRDAFSSLTEFHYVEGAAAENTAATMVSPIEGAKAAPTAVSQTMTAITKPEAGLLYAQPVTNGYQLVDESPKIVLSLLKTSIAESFIANNGSTSGIVFKKNGDWFFEYYKNNVLVSEKLSIKF